MVIFDGQTLMGLPWVSHTLVVRHPKSRWSCFLKSLTFYFRFKARDYLELRLKEAFGDKIHFNGKFETSVRLPNTCNVSFLGPGLEGRKILATVKLLQASVGAACHSGDVSHPSPILIAIGIPYNIAMNAVRLSVGRYTSKKDIDLVIDDLKAAVEFLRE